MLKKIYQELVLIRKELQAIRSSTEFSPDPEHLYKAILQGRKTFETRYGDSPSFGVDYIQF